MNCRTCGKPLSGNEVALYQKLWDREAKEPLCKKCLAAFFRCSEELMDYKIQQYIDLGCELFDPKE